MVSKDRLLDSLWVDSEALAHTATDHLTVPIPTCPGWFMVDLLVHTGGVQRAQAAMVRARTQAPMGISQDMFAGAPGLLEWLEHSTLFGETSNLDEIPPGLDVWFLEGAKELRAALSNADPSEPVWSWSADHTVRHYLRMMPVETAIHRWDAEAAVGPSDSILADLAEEGIGHTFDTMLPARREGFSVPAGQGETFGWTATDRHVSWVLTFSGQDVAVTAGESDQADVWTKGSASDIFLFLWHRISEDRLEVHGDGALLDRYFQFVPPR